MTKIKRILFVMLMLQLFASCMEAQINELGTIENSSNSDELSKLSWSSQSPTNIDSVFASWQEAGVSFSRRIVSFHKTSDCSDMPFYMTTEGSPQSIDLVDVFGNSLYNGLSLAFKVQLFDTSEKEYTKCSSTLSVDTSKPTVSFQTSTYLNINRTILVKATFNEAVVGLDLTDFNITNGEVVSVSEAAESLGTQTIFDISVRTIDSGMISFTLKENSVADKASNLSAESAQFDFVFDGELPEATITNVTAQQTNISSLVFSITFEEDVQNFTSSDLNVVNGTVSSFITASASSYNVTVTPSAQGDVSVSLPEGSVFDLAGNPNPLSNTSTINYDTGNPVPIFSTQSTSTNENSFPVIISFLEEIEGFTLSDITLTNALAANFKKITARSYQITVAPNNAATVESIDISILPGKLTDLSGNSNDFGTFNVVADKEKPTVIISSGAMSSGAFPVTLNFSENISDYDSSDLIITNGTVTRFEPQRASTISFSVAPTTSGNIGITLKGNSVSDDAGNLNDVSAEYTIVYDSTAPVATVSLVSTGVATNDSPILFSVTFDEDVTGFDDAVNDLSILNGTAVITPITAKEYTISVTPLADGLVTLGLVAGAVQNTSGILNAISNIASITADGTDPVATITSTSGSPTAVGPIPFDISLTEEAASLTAGDLQVLNGIINSFIKTSATTYELTVTPSSNATITVNLLAGAFSDIAGNQSTTLATQSIDYNGTRPSVVITSTESVSSILNPIPLTFTFSSDVTGFTDASGVVVSNGTITNFATTADPKVYTADLVPTADGDVSLYVNENVADNLGALNTASAPFNILYDGSNPTISLSSTILHGGATNLSPFTLTIDFDENVVDFDITDLQVVNGTLSAITTVTNFRQYTVDVTPTAAGIVSVSILDSTITDSYGNQNVGLSIFSTTYDTTSPVPVITSSISGSTVLPTFAYTVTFSKEVTSFTASDVLLVNASVEGLVQTNTTTYVVTVRPTTFGTVSLSVPADSVVDGAGNTNIISNLYSIYYIGSTDNFVSTWKTNINNETITLPLVEGYDYDFVVDWGDGSSSIITSYNDSDVTHSYLADDTYTITISGKLEAFSFNNSGDKDKLIHITDLGDMGWKDLSGAFYGASNLQTFTGGVTSNVTSMKNMFADCPSLTTINMTSLDTSNVLSMSGMFKNLTGVDELELSNFDTSNVQDMSFMFYGANDINQLNVDQFNTSSVTKMNSMFENMTRLRSINLRNFDTRNVTTMKRMFSGDTSLIVTRVDYFDTRSLTDMSYMYANTPSLRRLNISSFDTSNVVYMNSLFEGSSKMSSIDLSNFNTASVEKMSYMFSGMSKLEELDLSHFDVSKVVEIEGMFSDTNDLEKLEVNNWTLSSMPSAYNIFLNTYWNVAVYCDGSTFYGKTCN